MTDYDLVIVGGGPAGLTAGIYACCEGLKTLLLEKSCIGGQALYAPAIQNYPGYSHISGANLIKKFESQARGIGVKISFEEVKSVLQTTDTKTISTSENEYCAKAVLVATGAARKKLGVKGEEKFVGRGVSYCAVCNGFFFKKKPVAVVGGGDSALAEALALSKMAQKVYLIHRRSAFRASKILQAQVAQDKKIKPVLNTVIEAIEGDEKVEKIVLNNLAENKISELQIAGLFVDIGLIPNTDFIDVKKDTAGFIITDEDLATSQKGVFAAGDCRAKPLRQVCTAVADGAVAAYSAAKYIDKLC